ncbi:nascent polypeptide-associated complex subunit alpha, muscle-specific form-like [Uranotaenia lowii]|uniref:nascent polypeptide-associated complex subunit alpha, muscle-specific form-like n=1 Tax=Uranotaenia lowii TaxID=190385 RepID=UPI00247AB95F|nr:nascent polypeptide-associated complex subunit alpha, muscle-specific form-like [Uranotaenia lowii]
MVASDASAVPPSLVLNSAFCVSKVTTTRTVKSTSSGSNNGPKPSVDNLEQIWDESVLKQLLDSSTNYEERRKIRARLRQIMAEKEACADIVASVTADLQRERQLQHQKSNDSGSNSIQGESLLLPLLQGILLHKPGPIVSGGGVGGPIPGQRGLSNGGIATLSIPPVEDSGTESGEDLRLLAAGLHDNIEMYRGLGVGTGSSNVSGDGSSISNGRPQDQNGDSVLHEVTAALQRLQLSLRDGKNINLEANKRNALLTLVCRLQTGLMQPDKIPEQVSPVEELIDDKDDKVDYNQARRGSARFAKRRNRNNRHTVGVSREELADARRFIEEIGRMSSHSHSATPEMSKTPEIPPASNVLKKQPSLGTVLPSNANPTIAPAATFAMKRPSQFVPKEIQTPLKPALKSNDPAPTPVSRKSKQKLFRQSQSLDQSTTNGHELIAASQHKPIDVKPSQQTSSKVDPFKKPTQTAAQRALVKKYSFNDGSTSDEDEPRKNAEQVVLQKNPPKNTTVINTVQKMVNREVKQEPQKATSSTRKSEVRETVHPVGDGNKPLNKYTSKKLRMKRANTIDLPKNLLNNGAASDDDSEDERRSRECPREVKAKTPVSTTVKPVVEVPDFRPKTENDLKFMAFIQKQNQPAKQVWNTSLKDSHGSQNWTSKFDHLKKNFESTEKLNQIASPVKSAPKTSAMNFWKKAESSSFDEPHPVAPPRRDSSRPPKPLSQSQITSNAASKAPVQPKLPPKSGGIVYQPPPLPTKPKPATQPVPRSPAQSHTTPRTPTAMSPPTQFTHAPTSAFKPIPKKLPPANLDFKPVHPEPEIIKAIPANISNGLVKQIVASGFKETPEVKTEQPQIQLGLVKSIAAAGFHETPFIPAPKLERTPTQLVLNYQAVPERAESPPPAAPWAGKKQSDGNSRVANIASSRFAANQFGLHKGALPTQPQLTYQGSLKYAEKPLSFQIPERNQEKRPSLPDVGVFRPQPKQDFVAYTSTDYTQPESISTFTLNRSDSLTNPENQPLVLTSTNSIYSPSNVQYAPQHLNHTPQLNYLTVNDQHSLTSLSPKCIDEDDIESLDSQEMRVVARVMQAPVGQQASYSNNKPTQLSGSSEGRGSLMAQSLQGSLKKIQDKSPTPPKRYVTVPKGASKGQDLGSFLMANPVHRTEASLHDSTAFNLPKVEVTPQTPIAAKPQPQFAVPSHAIFNNVQGFHQARPGYEPPRPGPLARTDSWVRLNQQQQQTMPNSLMRAKSSHTLAVPHAMDGGYGSAAPLSVTDKQRTMEAYFAGQKPALNPLARTASNHNILRDKSGMTQNAVRPVSYAMGHSYNPAQYNIMTPRANEQPNWQSQSMYGNSSLQQRMPQQQQQQQQQQYYQPPLGGGLSRSRTMPHIPLNNLSLLDEDNIEDAFDELLSQSFAV